MAFGAVAPGAAVRLTLPRRARRPLRREPLLLVRPRRPGRAPHETSRVTLLHHEEITSRSFSAWRMGSIDLAKINSSVVLRFSEHEHFDPVTTPGRAALALIQELAEGGAGSHR